jgi:hypothetical protein
MPFKPKDLERLLQSKFGFEEAKSHSDDHQWLVLRLEGLPDIMTKLSHSKREVNKKIEGMIARQLRVSKPFFNEMFRCNRDREAYYTQVREDPIPPWNVTF